MHATIIITTSTRSSIPLDYSITTLTIQKHIFSSHLLGSMYREGVKEKDNTITVNVIDNVVEK